MRTDYEQAGGEVGSREKGVGRRESGMISSMEHRPMKSLRATLR